jgi:DNA-binding transcriptional regulator YhcF (GntR family)
MRTAVLDLLRMAMSPFLSVTPDAWQRALAELERLGFVELSEARQSGFVPADWQPTPENSTLHACSGPAIIHPDSR